MKEAFKTILTIFIVPLICAIIGALVQQIVQKKSSKTLLIIILALLFVTVFSGLAVVMLDKESEPVSKIEIPRIIQELATISDVNKLLAQLNEYNKGSVLAVGKKDDFGSPDSCYIFILDENNVYGTYQFNNDRYLDLSTKKILGQLPDELLGMQQIWVIESYKLKQ